jgi:hypothetical protein
MNENRPPGKDGPPNYPPQVVSAGVDGVQLELPSLPMTACHSANGSSGCRRTCSTGRVG